MTATALAAQTITPAEREEALRYLAATRDEVANHVQGLTDAQWHYKPAPDRWSVAEIVEHLAIVENRVTNTILVEIEHAEPAPADRNVPYLDALVLGKGLDRTVKYRGPDFAQATGRWTPAVSLAHFLELRAQTVARLESTPYLRQHLFPHPVLGPIDGYQWVLLVAAHASRHANQILEVKAAPGFPS